MQTGLGMLCLQPERAHIGHTHHAQPSCSSAQSDDRGDEPKFPCLRDAWTEPLRPWLSPPPISTLPTPPDPFYLLSNEDVEANPIELKQAPGLHTWGFPPVSGCPVGKRKSGGVLCPLPGWAGPPRPLSCSFIDSINLQPQHKSWVSALCHC